MEKVLNVLFEKQRFKLFLEIIKESRLCNINYDDDPYKGNTSLYLRKKINVNQATISYHITQLEKVGLITKKKKGKWIYLFPDIKTTKRLSKYLARILNIQGVEKKIFVKTFTPNIALFNKDFKDIVSLVENHGYKRMHTTKRKESFVIYLKKDIKFKSKTGSLESKEIFLNVILNNLTNIITVTNNVSDEINQEFLKLFSQYLTQKISANATLSLI